MDFKSPIPYIHTILKYVSSSSNISCYIWYSITNITLDYLRAKHKLQNIFQLWNEVTFSSKWLEWILALFAQNFSVFQRKKFLMEIKFFCCHPLLQQLHASLATSSKKRNWKAPWQPDLRSSGFRTASCLDAADGCREWEWASPCSELVRLGCESQGWAKYPKHNDNTIEYPTIKRNYKITIQIFKLDLGWLRKFSWLHISQHKCEEGEVV